MAFDAKAYKRQWYLANRERLLADAKAQYAADPEPKKRAARDRREVDVAAANKRSVEYQKRNREKVYARQRKWAANRRQTNVEYKLRTILRCRLYSAVRYNRKGGSAVKDLGCSIEFLKGWLESQFTEMMSWGNHGTVWHIDHKQPLTAFDLTQAAEVKEACHYTNLQPMLASENIRKGGIRKKVEV